MYFDNIKLIYLVINQINVTIMFMFVHTSFASLYAKIASTYLSKCCETIAYLLCHIYCYLIANTFG
jgi:hypothetical protein